MAAALCGIFILTVAISGGVFFARRNAAQQEKQVKVLLFVLFFWGLVFLQLIVFALGYYWFIKMVYVVF